MTETEKQIEAQKQKIQKLVAQEKRVTKAAEAVTRESRYSLHDRERVILIGKNSNLDYFRNKVWI